MPEFSQVPETLDDIAILGRRLLDVRGTSAAVQDAFIGWEYSVAEWLKTQHPGRGLVAEWFEQKAPLISRSGNLGSNESASLKDAVAKRLEWLHEKVAASNTIISTVPETLSTLNPTALEVRNSHVFLVHGHDEVTRELTARFLMQLGLSPIILHEQPNKSRTIIEKFAAYADVAFAVVLLTPDDIGGVAASSMDQMSPRARQNVIFELGYFIGRLGREKVCALYKGGVDILSDYKGVLYVPFDDRGAWKMELAREMKAAGLQIDLNAII